MEPRPASWGKVQRLLEKGVEIPNPLTVHVGEEVDLDRISGEDVVLYPGCRIYGARTVISAGCRIGHEAPVTLEDCALGPKVELKGGFFSRSVFLEKARMGSGAQVREGTLLEEEASGAHSVGLKQTILFPFVTLGSLVNFCDCLLAGGTSRRNHSEVGSGCIHFNYTPDQDKATASLFGDVPRGVMLNQPPIFLGGQAGVAGPLRLGFGTVVAAGSILRHDCPEGGLLISEAPVAGGRKPFVPATYPRLGRVLANGALYVANLLALASWYRHVRSAFFARQALGKLVHASALSLLEGAQTERLERLKAVAETVTGAAAQERFPEEKAVRQAFRDAVVRLEEESATGRPSDTTRRLAEAFLAPLAGHTSGEGGYIETIQDLPPGLAARGVAWLDSIVTDGCQPVAATLPLLKHEQITRQHPRGG